MKTTYSEKLQDPRWQKRRLEIMQRDDFACRDCKRKDKTLHVHHANGYHHGMEPWEYPGDELVTLCADCHDAKHRRNNIGIRFYLAGKVSHTCWRHRLVNLREQRDDGPDFSERILTASIYGRHHYTGPYFISCDHGCYHGNGTHGMKEYGFQGNYCDMGVRSGRDTAFNNCQLNIYNCDILFAWMDCLDCYGTIAEIGLACGLSKTVLIGMDKRRDDLWFVEKMSPVPTFIDPDPVWAFRKAVTWAENKWPALPISGFAMQPSKIEGQP